MNLVLVFHGFKKVGKSMFKTNDLVSYGSFGICRIDRIGKKNETDSVRTYFELSPVYESNMMISIPTDNETLVSKMKRIMSKEDLFHVLENIKSEKFSWIQDAMKRKQSYQDILENGEPIDLLRLIKEVQHQRHLNASKNGVISQSDKHSCDLAEKKLYHLFAFILDIEPNQVKKFILDYELNQ